jgi:hypothetical protein
VPVTPSAPAANKTSPAARNASIWLVANVTNEALLADALSYEYPAGVPPSVLAERVTKLQQTMQHIKVEREFIYRGGRTEVRIKLNPETGIFKSVIFENITLYDYIPKCFAQLVGDVVFDQNVSVLEDDPLVRRVMRPGEEYSYSAALRVDSRCKELFRIIGVGDVSEAGLAAVLVKKGFSAVVRTFWLETAVLILIAAGLAAAAFIYKEALGGLR